MRLSNHFRIVSQVIKDDKELLALEQHISEKGGRITKAQQVREGTQVFYTLPTVKED